MFILTKNTNYFRSLLRKKYKPAPVYVESNFLPNQTEGLSEVTQVSSPTCLLIVNLNWRGSRSVMIGVIIHNYHHLRLDFANYEHEIQCHHTIYTVPVVSCLFLHSLYLVVRLYGPL